jgi:hypothetical protein
MNFLEERSTVAGVKGGRCYRPQRRKKKREDEFDKHPPQMGLD